MLQPPLLMIMKCCMMVMIMMLMMIIIIIIIVMLLLLVMPIPFTLHTTAPSPQAFPSPPAQATRWVSLT